MNHPIFTFLLVFSGGGTGAVCRYSLGLLLQPWASRFPFATFVSNILACLVLGMIVGFHTQGILHDRYRLLLATGFCGGFSTFSSFTAETWEQWQNGQFTILALNIVLNLAVCWIFFVLGLKLTHWFNG
jgi:CrcB protein